MRVISLVLVMGFTMVSPMAAQTQFPPNRFLTPKTPLFKPSTPLFKPSRPLFPADLKASEKPAMTPRPPVKIVCGMTMVPVDSSLDPKIERPVPSTGTTFTLKTVKPPVCRQ